MEIYFSKSKTNPAQHREKRQAELKQMPSDKAVQEQSSKSARKAAAPKQARAAERQGDTEARPDQTHTATDPSQRDQWTRASVTTQTDQSLDPHRAALGPERHHAYTQTEGEEGKGSSSAPVSPSPALPAPSSLAGLAGTSTFPIPADPAQLAERILRNRTQLSAAFDDTEYEPYGLPEVVMKGDI